MKNLKGTFFKWLIEHDMTFLLLWISALQRGLTFPGRLFRLRTFVQLRERQALEFHVGEWVRRKETPEDLKHVKVVLGPQPQQFFDENSLGGEVPGGRIWKERTYRRGGAMHSFYTARDPWRIIRIDHSNLASDIRFFLRGIGLTHRCSLTVENAEVVFGEKVIPWVPADLVEKVLPDTV